MPARSFETTEERAATLARVEAQRAERRRTGKTKPQDRSDLTCAAEGCATRVTYASLAHSEPGQVFCSRECAGFPSVLTDRQQSERDDLEQRPGE